MNKIVSVKVTTLDKKEQRPTSAIVEEDRGAGYLRVDGRDMTTNSGKEETFELTPGQRLVIEGWPAQEVVMDAEQGAAVLRSNQGTPRISDSAASGKTASDLRREADEMDRRERESQQRADSAKSDADAAHKKTISELEKSQQTTSFPNPTQGPAGAAKPGQATATSPMKSSKDMK